MCAHLQGHASRYTGFLGGVMKFISFRIDDEDYDKLKKNIEILYQIKPTEYLKRVALTLSGKEINAVPSDNLLSEKFDNAFWTYLSDKQRNTIINSAKTRHWSLSKEIRFRLNLTMTNEPVLLDEEITALTATKNAVNKVGRNLSAIIKRQQLLAINDPDMWEDIKLLSSHMEALREQVSQLTRTAANQRTVKLRNEVKG